MESEDSDVHRSIIFLSSAERPSFALLQRLGRCAFWLDAVEELEPVPTALEPDVPLGFESFLNKLGGLLPVVRGSDDVSGS